EKARQMQENEFAKLYEELLNLYQQRLEGAEADRCAPPERSSVLARRVDLIRELTRVERQTAVRLRNQGRINDEVLRQIQYELDLTETKYALASERARRARPH